MILQDQLDLVGQLDLWHQLSQQHLDRPLNRLLQHYQSVLYLLDFPSVPIVRIVQHYQDYPVIRQGQRVQ